METIAQKRPHLVAGTYFSEEDYKKWMNWQIALNADLLASLLPGDSFGLTDATAASKAAFRLQMEGDHLVLTHCYAVTLGGAIIAVNAPDTPTVCSGPVPPPPPGQSSWEVWLSADLYGITGAGVPNPSFSPLRYPAVVTALRLHFVSPGTLLAGQLPHSFVVGQLGFPAGGWALDEAFVPPCLHVGGHPKMTAEWTVNLQTLHTLRQKSLQIIGHANAPTHPNTALRQMMAFWLLPLLGVLDREIPTWERLGRRLSPSEMHTTFRVLANALQTGLGTLPNAEALLQYLARRLDTTGHGIPMETFRALLAAMSASRPSAWQSNGLLLAIENFRTPILLIFNTLAAIEQYRDLPSQDPSISTAAPPWWDFWTSK